MKTIEHLPGIRETSKKKKKKTRKSGGGDDLLKSINSTPGGVPKGGLAWA